MIRIAILGADSRDAGELVRILVNHPDAEICAFVSTEKADLPVTSVHHGLIGECSDKFVSSADPDKVDLVIAVGDTLPQVDFANGPKLVWFPTAGAQREANSEDMVYGQSETNRKALVRGARAALVPSPVASIYLASVVPLHQYLDSGSEIEMTVLGPDLVLRQLGDMQNVAKEITEALGDMYPDIKFALKINTGHMEGDRALRLQIKLPLTLSQQEVQQAYEMVYDDHNFSFVVPDPVDAAEVVGTEKCLISLRANGSNVSVDSIADMRMRGGAGEAVHLLNLLFGLQERTGLDLKAIAY